MTGVYKVIIKNNLVYKYLNKDNEIGKILNERLKHKNHLHYFNFQIVKIPSILLSRKHLQARST